MHKVKELQKLWIVHDPGIMVLIMELQGVDYAQDG